VATGVAPISPVDLLARALDAALPQTQCTRCGYPDCRAYAQAMAEGEAGINQCPPGGQEGVLRLARITGRPAVPLNPVHGAESVRLLAVIDEAWCIGCTLCLAACPVDCIVGGPKLMHTVIDAQCTGCELCLPACPVDCIALVPASGERTGWQAWSAPQAEAARTRHAFHRMRLARDASEQRQRLDGARRQARIDRHADPHADPQAGP
jgi:Na+-translocating ferredoxin:NAD+ oxidoreductase subunit B